MNKKIKLGCGVVVFVVLGAILLLVIVAYLFFSAPRTKAELYGTYVFDRCKPMEGDLILYPDGTYMQTMTIKATLEVFSARGTWKYDYRGLLDGRVDFYDFLYLSHRNGLKENYAHQTPGIASLNVEYWYGQLVIGRVDGLPEWRKVSDKTD
jgi:hypothetical protein